MCTYCRNFPKKFAQYILLSKTQGNLLVPSSQLIPLSISILDAFLQRTKKNCKNVEENIYLKREKKISPLPGHPDKNLSAKQQLHAQKQNEEKVIEFMPKNCLIKINQKATIFLFRRLKTV